MRVGLFYQPSPQWPKFQWVSDALEKLGHEVQHGITMDDLSRLDGTCDAVLFQHKGSWRKRVVEVATPRRAVWATWWFDAFLSNPHRDYLQLFGTLNRCMDAVFVKETEMLDAYRAEGINAHWMDQGCPETYAACEHKKNPEFDVLVLGTRMGVYRQRHRDALALARSGLRVAWAGEAGNPPQGIESLPWCHPSYLPQLMSRAATVLHVDLRDDVPGYRSDRFWLATGAGACVVGRVTGHPDVPHLRYDEMNDETIRKVRDLARSHESRVEMGKAARDAVMSGHTYRHRVRDIVAVLEGCRGTARAAV